MASDAWWKERTVYQIYPRSFCDSNGDGIGDLRGIIGKLDYLKDLGVGIVWLSPVYKSPNDDNGYDISDYTAINPEFGTMEDMDALIEKARELDIKIIMDLVINHTSDEHEWFVKSAAGDSEYRDYYIWRKGKGKKPPNNWTSFFAGDAWQKRGEEYYLHLFSPKQPDLNWNNPKVYDEIKKVMKFWLDKGIAGFRCDVINIIYKTSLADGKKRLALTGKEHYLSQEGCHRLLQRLNEDVLNDYDCFTVGETVMVTPKEACRLTNRDKREMDMVFGFEHMECDQWMIKWFKTKYKPERLIAALVKWQTNVPWNTVYFENHDQPRSVSRFGDEGEYRVQSAKMLGGLLFTLKGTPFVYEGQEIGMLNGDFKNLDEVQDVESHNVDKTARRMLFTKGRRWKMIKRTTRDNARTPMQWTGGKNAGFTSGTPWLKVNANCADINVEAARGDSDGIFDWYKNMIALRASNVTLLYGEFVDATDKKFPRVFRFKRVGNDGVVTVVANMTAKTVRDYFVKRPTEGTILQSNYADSSADLRPYEFMATMSQKEKI